MTKKKKGWHPHIHALIDTSWLAVNTLQPGRTASAEMWRRRGKAACEEVAEQWSLCMGGRSSSVKVRRIWSHDGGDIRPALAEVLKYSITSENLLSLDKTLTPVLDALTKTRLVTSWGTLYKLGVKRIKKCAEPCGQCHSMDAWMPSDVIERMVGSTRSKKATHGISEL